MGMPQEYFSETPSAKIVCDAITHIDMQSLMGFYWQYKKLPYSRTEIFAMYLLNLVATKRKKYTGFDDTLECFFIGTTTSRFLIRQRIHFVYFLEKVIASNFSDETIYKVPRTDLN